MADEPSSPPWQPERGLDVTAQLQNLRNLLNSDRQSSVEHQRRLETFEQEMSLRSGVLERQRRDLDTHLQDRSLPSVPTSSSPSSLVRSRRRAFRPSERLQRHRDRYNPAIRADAADMLINPRRATPPPAFTESVADDYGTEAQVNREQRFRAKRRKLDDGTYDDESRVVSYGDEGRVTPGPLKMEITRCDGGDFYESPVGSAQFVLQDDKSVYSTKENKCNLLLKHIGGMPFSLTKIIIKAPRYGFDSPIQEGMIFVAMNEDRLLEKTSQYEKYSPKSYRFHHPYRRHDYYRPSQEYLNSSRSPLRSIDRTRTIQDQQPPWLQQLENDPELETSLISGFDVSFMDPSDHEESPSFTPRSPMSWRDLDAEYSLRSYADRYRPNAGNNDNPDNPSLTSSESEDEETPTDRNRGNHIHELDEEFIEQRRYLNQMRMARERGDPNFYVIHPGRRPNQEWRTREEPVRPPPSNRLYLRSGGGLPDESRMSIGNSTKSTNDALPRTPQAGNDILAPHARFSMAESQTSIAIHFDPPVAGRYILIKLWASCPGANIDIQCVLPHGYGGPRFFPSVEIR